MLSLVVWSSVDEAVDPAADVVVASEEVIVVVVGLLPSVSLVSKVAKMVIVAIIVFIDRNIL